MTLQEELQKLGLSEKAARTYLAALEVGSSPVQQIAQKASLSRTTVYPQIEELIKLGLITTFNRGKKTFYSAEPPRQLDLLLKKQEDEITAKREELIKKIPEFEAIYSLATDKPAVKFYQGSEGWKAYAEELFGNPKYKHFLSFTDYQDVHSESINYRNAITKRRSAAKIPIKIIYTHPDGPQDYPSDPYREVKFIPYDKFPFQSNISVEPNVGIQIQKYRDGYMGILIESPQVAQTMASIFYLCWEAADKYN